MPKNLIEQMLKTIRNYDMLKAGDTVLAAVSGGPDSVFLLHALTMLKNKLKLKKIVVCNLDHGLRGKESANDSLFVKKLAKGPGLEFIQKKICLKNDGRRENLSMEEIAREERYKFFREAAKKAGANVLATGHTLDDQAETVLMRIIKGSALKGIVGISPVREERTLHIVRPLLEIEKGEIVEYLNGTRLQYKTDSTNIDTKILRNAVRREIIPFMERYNPRFKRALFNLAGHLREDFEFIEKEKKKAVEIIRGRGAKYVEIELKELVLQPRALQKEILRSSLERAGGIVKKLSRGHWKEIEALIKHKRKGSSVDLPGGIRATRTERVVEFYRK